MENRSKSRRDLSGLSLAQLLAELQQTLETQVVGERNLDQSAAARIRVEFRPPSTLAERMGTRVRRGVRVPRIEAPTGPTPQEVYAATAERMGEQDGEGGAA